MHEGQMRKIIKSKKKKNNQTGRLKTWEGNTKAKNKRGMQHNGTDNEGQNDVVKTTFIRTKSTSRPEVSIPREDQDQVDRVKTGIT